MSNSPVQMFIAATIFLAAASLPRSAPAAQASSVVSLPDREPFEFTFRFDSAELQTDRGTRRVYQNLILKAQRACSQGSSSMLDLNRMDRRCTTALVNDVVLRIGSPTLAALHAKSPAANGLAAASHDPDFAGSL